MSPERKAEPRVATYGSSRIRNSNAKYRIVDIENSCAWSSALDLFRRSKWLDNIVTSENKRN